MSILLTMMIGYLLHLILPFWAIMLAGFLAAMLVTKGFSAFFMPFIGGLFLWGLVSIQLGSSNADILASRVGVLMGELSGYTLYALTALLGGVLAGVGGLFAWSVKRLW